MTSISSDYKMLIVNDDGYKSGGIRALIAEMSAHYDVVAVAPDSQQSWKGKSISGHNSLEMVAKEYEEFKGYTVTGTPADCTQLGIYELFKSEPDCVISGINDGANVGMAHILSSGTVGAALEAAIQGVPAFATSIWGLKKAYPNANFDDSSAAKHFKVAAEITRNIVEKVMSKGYPEIVQVVCINIPFDATTDSDIVITRPHKVAYGRLFGIAEDGNYNNIGNSELTFSDEEHSDLFALTEGKVSVVPLTIELSSDEGQRILSEILEVPIAKK